MTPRYKPAPPKPQMARPMIRASIVGAAPQIADPTSKRKTQSRYSIFASK